MSKHKLDENSIVFVKQSCYTDGKIGTFLPKESRDPSDRILFLLSKICNTDFFEKMPKTFTISTKNSALHFNIQMLKETSPVISKFIQDNPNENNYQINIVDDGNALTKIEQLYQGKPIFLKEENEMPIIQQFFQILQITKCPSELNTNCSQTYQFDLEGYSLKFNGLKDSSIEIYPKFFKNFLRKDEFQFKIITTKKEYKCSIFAVYTSDVIRQILEKDPTVKEFEYKFDDKDDQFQLICDFFNYKKINIEKVNIDSLRSIAEDLQINCIINFIDNYYNNRKKFNQIIEKHKILIDSIDELFELLYNIKKLGIEKVRDSIVQSKWSKKEEDVQELAAFIIQVVKPSFSLQKEMAELIIQLNKEANNDNKLHILIPFIVERLMASYWPKYSFTNSELNKNIQKFQSILDEIESINLNDKCIYSFIRILYKRGIIPKEEIIQSLTNYTFYNNALNAFFLPELVEINPNNFSIIAQINRASLKIFNTKIDSNLINKNINFIGHYFHLSKAVSKYFPDKLDLYEKMLDKMEPDDELTNSLLKDDVDSFQKIINKEGIDIHNFKVSYNIFDDFEEDQNLINYSAFYGSIKCFNYLISNDVKIDETTFYFAIYGGNNEIIKIVDQKSPKKIKMKMYADAFTYQYKEIFEDFDYAQNLNFNSNWFYLKKINLRNIRYIYLTMSSFFDKYNDNNIQRRKSIYKNYATCFLNCCNINNKIAPTITMHQNELFDWTFQNIFVNKNKYGNSLKHIACLSAMNGNVHSLMALIDNGFQISKEVISFSAKNGFYSLTKLLLDLYDNNNLNHQFDYNSIVDFGNLSILNLFIDKMNQFDIIKVILHAIKKNCTTIIKYIFDNIDKFDFIQFDNDFIKSALTESIRTKYNELLFNFLFDQYMKLNPKSITFNLLSELLKESCIYSNFSATKTITGYLLNEDIQCDFTDPFYTAALHKSNKICQFFIDKKVFIDFVNTAQIPFLGSINIELFEKVVNSVDPTLRFLFNKCIHYAIIARNIKVIDYILKENPSIDFDLIEAVDTEDVAVVDLILKYNSKPLFINQNSSKGPALCKATKQGNLAIVKRLLSTPQIDVDLINDNALNSISIAEDNLDVDIVKMFIDYYTNDIQNNTFKIIKAFQSLIDSINIDIAINDEFMKIIRLFTEIKSISKLLWQNDHYNNHSSLLNVACNNDQIDIVEYLLKFDDIKINTHYSPLCIAIEKKNSKIAEFLIKQPKININLQTLHNEAPLVLAAKNDLKEIVDLLIKNDRFDPFEEKLNLAFLYANTEIAKQLITLKDLDVNQQIYENDGPQENINALIYSVNINDIEKVDLIVNHPSFNVYKSQVEKAIFIAVKNNNIEIFRKLIPLVNDNVNLLNDKHQSLIEYASLNLSGNIIDSIFNNKLFESKKEVIYNAFVQSYSNARTKKQNEQTKNNYNYYYRGDAYYCEYVIDLSSDKIKNKDSIPKKSSIIEIMQKIIDYDNEHDKVIKFDELLPNGKSFFTSIKFDFSDIKKVSEFLISHGVDPNKADENDVYPLEHAITIGSINLVKYLVNSNKINYSQLKNKNSYLHLAAQNKNSSILSFLLQKNESFDVNSINEKGETPLFDASRSKCIDNINLLFKKDDLDYLHKNEEGKDALDIIVHSAPTEIEAIKQSREKFHDKLISTIDEI